AVLDRVVTEHHQPAAAAEYVTGFLQGVLEGAEFIVDEDAQRLEGAAGRMVTAWTTRIGGLDDLRPPDGVADRLLVRSSADGPGDAAAVPLLAVAVDDRRQLRFAALVDDVSCAAAAGAHPHVERPFL